MAVPNMKLMEALEYLGYRVTVGKRHYSRLGGFDFIWCGFPYYPESVLSRM